MAVKRDTTAERELEAQLRQAQRLEAVGQLAGGVAHDFNNLLTAIRGYGELIRDALPDGTPTQADVAELLRAAERASILTRQLLAFSRRQVLAPEVLDPAGVIDGLAPMLRHLLGEHIELVTSSAGEARRVRADPGQLEQVIVNLAVNARDAMLDGGRLDIRTESMWLDAGHVPDAGAPGESQVRITVTDTGSGMDEATLSRVFEPFFSTKAQGKGTGMGLATVYGIVRQSGGSIDASSIPGSGSTFTIDLPAVTDTDGPAGGEARPGEEGVARHEADAAARILLVEDEPAVRDVVARMLRRLGYRVEVTPGGAEALAWLARPEAEADLLLTDVRMPGMQGPELARRARGLRPGIRVLLMSAFSADVEDAASSGDVAATILDKPFDTLTLGAAVRAALETGADPDT